MKKILIVDDSATAKMLFRAYMPEDAKYELHEANDQASALDIADWARPDIIFMDYNMPDKLGTEIAAEMINNGSHAKFVLLTANTQEVVLKEADDLGFVGVLEKPITREKIVAILQQVDP